MRKFGAALAALLLALAGLAALRKCGTPEVAVPVAAPTPETRAVETPQAALAQATKGAPAPTRAPAAAAPTVAPQPTAIPTAEAKQVEIVKKTRHGDFSFMVLELEGRFILMGTSTLPVVRLVMKDADRPERALLDKELKGEVDLNLPVQGACPDNVALDVWVKDADGQVYEEALSSR